MTGELTQTLAPAIPFTGSKRWIVRFLPSLTDFAFLLPACTLFMLMSGATGLLADADTGWHLRTGEWIIQHRAIPTTDLFSFTKANQPWFAWEWGWDLLFGAIHSAWGLTGVVFANVLILCTVSALLFRLIRRSCDNDLLSLLFTEIAMCGSAVHWLARPHLLSWVFFLAFAHLLLSAERGKTKALYWLPPLMLLWTNIHGSFFLGIAMILIAAISHAHGIVKRSALAAAYLRDCEIISHRSLTVTAQLSCRHRTATNNAGTYVLSALACVAATFVNPYTWHLHQHVISYLRDSRQMDMMQEFQSISFHHAPAGFFEIMLLLGAAAALWCIQRRKWSGAATLLLFAHLSLFAVRNVPLYLILASPWIACMLGEAFNHLGQNRWLSEIAREFQPVERIERLHVTSLLGVLFILLALVANQPGFEARFDPKKFPNSAIPVIEQQGARHIFTTDQWGAYLIYRRFPETKVFVDDRSDFYGADFLDRCAHIVNARWDWEINLRRFSVDMVIVMPDTPIATVLKKSPGWRMLLDDGSVIIFAPKGAAAQPKTLLTSAHDFQPLPATEEASLGSGRACKSKTKTYERRSL